MASELQSLMADASTRRDRIRVKTLEGLKGIFPIEGRNAVLDVKNVTVKKKDYSSNQQKDALMRGRTLHEPVVGTLVLKDKKTGKVLDEKNSHTLAHLPYFTERHTFIVGGNEYDIPSQMRLKSGVYTRERGNGEFEAAFNLSKGSNFRLSMEPDSGRLHMELGTSKIPLYALLRSMGVPDTDIRSHWGDALRDMNAASFKGKEEQSLNKAISKIKRRGDVIPATLEGKQDFVREYFDNTAMDPEVNHRTLGLPVDKANPLALLTASKKLIDVQKGAANVDDRDSLEFKTLHSVDDFFKERLAIDAKRTVARKLAMKMNQNKSNEIKAFVPSSTFTKSLNTFLTSSTLGSIPMQINPVEIIDHAARITSLGEGGISSERAIPYESRKVHNTHFGVLDPVRTPETFKAGVDVRGGLAAFKDDEGNLYSLMRDVRTGRIAPVSATTLAKSVVAFPDQDHRTKWDALRGTDVVSVPKKEVDYQLPDPTFMYSPATALVPFLDGMQGNRAMMGAKFQTQALPLVDREAPFVQAASSRKGQSMEQEIARLIVPTAQTHGIVTKIDDDYVYVKPDGPKTAAPANIKIPYDTYFPLSAKTYLHNDVKVKVGDKVRPDQPLASSNYTKNDRLALGKNMSVAYMAYYGKNSNDAVVISENASKKLTSEHMYKEVLAKGSDIITGKDKYVAHFGMQFTSEQLGKLDSNGVAKPGVLLNYGDPVILGLRKAPPTPEAALLGNFHKSLVTPFKDVAVTWDKLTSAEVVDAVNAARQIMVTVRTREQMKVGDKLSNRFGGKGVVSEIIPNERMIQDAAGNPLDVLFTSAGVVSRINPAQIVEASLGKVAAKTGKPIVVPQFMREDNVKFAKNLLKEHGLKDKETVYDPVSDKKIKDIFVGNSYIHKLFKSTETNYAARGVSDYDINLQPTRGGDEGAKGIGKMEINALLAHNARNVLKEDLTTKSEKSDEFWRAYEFGLPAPPPKTPFVSEKFISMLQGAGINVDKSGSQVALGPMTDKDVTKLSSGALAVPSLEKSKSFMVSAKNLKPENGGLFDPALTGGLNGTRWAHIELTEPIVNPIFEEPVRRLLGMTKQELRAEIAQSGGKNLRKRLNKIDLKKKEEELLQLTKVKRGVDLDNAVKQLKYVRALQTTGFENAGDAYTLSKLPVIPPVMRPILPSQRGGELQVSDLNYLYRDVGLASEALRGISTAGLPEATGDARLHLHDATSALFGTTKPTSPQLKGREAKGFVEQITGAGSPKSGFLHKKILKRQQDLSGRATATPDNTLNMDQIGIPEDMLWVTYSKFIMRRLIGQGYKPAIASQMLEERHPAAKAILDAEIQKRPVFVNRAPSLHKHNFVAAYPVSVPGKSLRVNPFMERGQNLDYDGDTMQIHVPIGDKATAEARDLTLSKLLFSDKNRDDLMIFPQHEAILGTYLATAKKEPGRAKSFKTKAEAMEAYRRGAITMNTPVKIEK
jgi:DNA-directed RNA polymerase subunit beta